MKPGGVTKKGPNPFVVYALVSLKGPLKEPIPLVKKPLRYPGTQVKKALRYPVSGLTGNCWLLEHCDDWEVIFKPLTIHKSDIIRKSNKN